MIQFKILVKLFCKSNLIAILILFNLKSEAQKRDRIWLFADRAGIDFNDLSNPIAITSNITDPCLNSFTSIADSSGQLLFYCASVYLTSKAMFVFDKNGNTMQNGDSLFGYPWVCQGSMIVPFPNNNNLYYLFTADRTGAMGNYLYYSIIDISLNGGLGSVISKNNLFLTDYVNEKLNATKHANGRDWWLVVQSTNTDSLFHKFLITPSGILGPFDQKIGSGNNRDKFHGQMIFSRNGNKLGLVSPNSTIDFFDFDRCTGELYNYKSAGEGVISYPNYYHGCSFSANGNVFYASSIWYEYKNIYQYDLTANDIRASKQLIYSYPDTGLIQYLEIGMHLLGPDEKIYIAKGKYFGAPNWDSYYTHHMDVIANPDNFGPTCNYTSNSFDLVTGKTTQGLPTMLNYNLGPVVGSVCDSLTNNIPGIITNDRLFTVYPNPFENEITIHSLYSIAGKLIIQDEIGKIIFSEKFEGNKTFETSFLKSGIYFVKIETNNKTYIEKIIKLN